MNKIIFITLITLLSCSNKNAKFNIAFKFRQYPQNIIKYSVKISKISYKNSIIDSNIIENINNSLNFTTKIINIYNNKNAKFNNIITDNNKHKFNIEVKISPFGEILTMKNKNNTQAILKEKINILSILEKFYPSLPYTPQKANDTWTRKQIISYSDKGSWGDIDVIKKFRLDSISIKYFYISAKINGDAKLKYKNKKSCKGNISISSNINFIIDKNSTVIKEFNCNNIIKKEGKKKILTLSNYNIKYLK